MGLKDGDHAVLIKRRIDLASPVHKLNFITGPKELKQYKRYRMHSKTQGLYYVDKLHGLISNGKKPELDAGLSYGASHQTHEGVELW
jgi:hypothetical protein